MSRSFSSTSPRAKTRILLSADFLDEHGNTVFPDIGLGLLAGRSGIEAEFLREYKAVYNADQLAGGDVLLSLKPKVTAESLAGVERLVAIGRYGVGYDNVDVAACTENDIALYITRKAVVRPVASSIVALVLAASHRMVWKDRLIRRGEWVGSTRRLGREPRGRVVGTIGLGNIAREALRLLRVFEVGRFLAFDPFVTAEEAGALGVELVTLDELLRESDYVLVNCPLTEGTRKLIGERELRLMKADAVLINTARGPIVDEGALVRVLEEGRIGCAGLDVFEQEPLAADSPLRALDHTILSSHSLCWTEELFRDMGREAVSGAVAILEGRAPENVVNREVLERPGFRRKLERLKNGESR